MVSPPEIFQLIFQFQTNLIEGRDLKTLTRVNQKFKVSENSFCLH